MTRATGRPARIAARSTKPASHSDFTALGTRLEDANALELQLGALLSAAADLVLVVDAQGIVADVACNLAGAAKLGLAQWRGTSCETLVDNGSRSKLRRLLAAAQAGRYALRQVLRHPTPQGDDFSVSYAALRLSASGKVLLLGQHQRALVEMQSRLQDERLEYERQRREQRRAAVQYRQVFEASELAMLVVEVASGVVFEANAPAAQLLQLELSQLVGKKFATLFERTQRVALRALFDPATNATSDASLSIPASQARVALRVVVEALDADERRLVAVRLLVDTTASTRATNLDAKLASLVRGAAEAVVLSSTKGDIVWANAAFLRMTGHPALAQVEGRRLADFLSLPQLELAKMVANARRYRQPQTLRGMLSLASTQDTEVEISALALLDESPPALAFVLRPMAASVQGSDAQANEVFQSADKLIALVGKVPMKGMVRDATDQVEKKCIETALRLTGNNRALAAKVLGLSRQSLYLKLHQFNLADASDADFESPQR